MCSIRNIPKLVEFDLVSNVLIQFLDNQKY